MLDHCAEQVRIEVTLLWQRENFEITKLRLSKIHRIMEYAELERMVQVQFLALHKPPKIPP